MDPRFYSRQSHRDLPRRRCVVRDLLGPIVGTCRGSIHRHHTDPDDPDSETIEVCARHHPKIQALVRALRATPEPRRCPHPPGTHRYPGAREACERRLNRLAA